MRLTYICSACNKHNYLKTKVETRPELQKKLGEDEIQVNCNNCGKTDKKHINSISAVVDNRIVLLGVGIGLIVTGVFWNAYGLISIASFGVALLFWISENKALSGFNKYNIRRK